MQDLLFAYLKDPSLDRYLTARTALLEYQDYNPFATDLDALPELLESENYEEAQTLLEHIIFPHYFLSPRAHLMLGMIYDRHGLTNESETEMVLGAHCLRGIELTGEGSQEKPMLVTRTSDGFDILNARELEVKDHVLEVIDDRRYDVLTTTDGQSFWFDITDISNILRDILDELDPEW